MIEQDISKARKKVQKAKAAYDAAIEELSRLLDEQQKLEAKSRITLDGWTFLWNGESVWDAGNGTVDCTYEAKAVFKPTQDIRGPEIRQLQIAKSGFSQVDLYQALEKSLKNILDSEFEDYCQEDDYYQPVVEDFDAEYYIRKWAEERGLELTAFEGDGFDGGFEPKRRRW